MENIDHTRTQMESLRTIGIRERFHRKVLDEFFRVMFRQKLYSPYDRGTSA